MYVQYVSPQGDGLCFVLPQGEGHAHRGTEGVTGVLGVVYSNLKFSHKNYSKPRS